MGVRYSAADSALLIQTLTNNVTIANQITDRLSSGCDHLMAVLDSGELQGAAYTAGRGLFSDIIIPAIKKLQEAIDDIQAELRSYKLADSEVSEFGTLDWEQLHRLRELKQRQRETVELQIEENEAFLTQVSSLLSGKIGQLWQETNALYEIQYQLEMGIRELEDKIYKLEWFVTQVSRYFTDSLTVLNLAIKGATQLSQVLVDSDGSYSIQGLDMSWVAQMKNEEIQTYAVKEEERKLYQQQLSQRIREIKNNSATSEITKADQIVKAYEDYLYQINKEALDDYWKKRKSYGDKWDLTDRKMTSIIESIEKELGKKLQASDIDIKDITTKMGSDILEVTGQDGWNYLQFKDLVDTGQPMDLKSRQYSDQLPFSIWSRKWTADLRVDYLGNYLYGYVGQGMLAVDGDLLKYAAGAAQEFSNIKEIGLLQADRKALDSFLSGNYFDNPGDSAMIQDGIDAYNNKEKIKRQFYFDLP